MDFPKKKSTQKNEMLTDTPINGEPINLVLLLKSFIIMTVCGSSKRMKKVFQRLFVTVRSLYIHQNCQFRSSICYEVAIQHSTLTDNETLNTSTESQEIKYPHSPILETPPLHKDFSQFKTLSSCPSFD